MPDSQSVTSTPLRPTAELGDSGLLWLINRVVFHPRGFALAFTPDGTQWQVLGDGTEPWLYEPETAEDLLFAHAEATLDVARSAPADG